VSALQAIVAGGLLVLLGLSGLVVFAGAGRQDEPGRRRRGRARALWIVGALVAEAGGTILLGVGFTYPLMALHSIRTELLESNKMLRAAVELQSERARLELLAQPKYQDPKRLTRHMARVFSQNGEDGIIAEVFRRIGTTNRYFVEFGASDGTENNTVLLLQQGWGGLWIEGDADLVRKANARFRAEVAGRRLTTMEAFITAENIEDLFRKGGVPEEFDLLCIDIDRNDYYVWETITGYRPRIVVIEYNPLFPPTISWVVPYDPKAMWNGTSHTGASLRALEELGAKKGYGLVGCTLEGVNAFFVRNDLLADHFAPPYTALNHYEPARYRLSQYDSNHRRLP
jgi:hypothetical protein